MATCTTYHPSSLVASSDVLRAVLLGAASTHLACLPPASRWLCIGVSAIAFRVPLRAIAKPRREAAVSFGRALAKKISSNSFASKSNEEIEAGFRRQYHVLAGSLRVSSRAGSLKLTGRGLSCISGVNEEPPFELSPTSPFDLRTSFWTSSSR
ncbi:hypothetical protein B296_00010709 [Ensete ventricosum]|uniref:Uncharacterized protein n=1 Tax=Ensete ventricosum TaxID=4639 RepID=A0A427AHW5_ENSVE|nr:hypothetical protein B296_00010709 [Ensete ventricosum]